MVSRVMPVLLQPVLLRQIRAAWPLLASWRLCLAGIRCLILRFVEAMLPLQQRTALPLLEPMDRMACVVFTRCLPVSLGLIAALRCRDSLVLRCGALVLQDSLVLFSLVWMVHLYRVRVLFRALPDVIHLCAA